MQRIANNETSYVTTVFASGSTASIDVYNLTTNAKIVDAAAMSEVAATGVFKYLFNQTVTNKTEFLCIVNDGTNTRNFKLEVGGYMDALALEATAQVIKTEVDKIQLIPINPLLVTDSRIDDMKAVLDQISFTGGNLNAIANVVTDKTGYELTATNISAVVQGIESGLINDGDGETFMQSLITNINANFSVDTLTGAVIALAVRNEIAPELSRLDANVSNAGGGLDETGLHAALNSYTNKADYQGQNLAMLTADKVDLVERFLSGQIN